MKQQRDIRISRDGACPVSHATLRVRRGRPRLYMVALFLFLALGASAQERTHVLIILDCSHSMWDRWQSDAKIKVTQRVLLKFVDSVAHQQEVDVALRVFGHLNKNQYGTRLEVPFSPSNREQLRSKIKTLVPNGGCTVSDALESSLNDFPASADARNIILIITDGMDDCDGEICQVARRVQLSGVVVQSFILGIGNPRDFQSNLDCAGRFSHVPNEEDFTQALYDIFSLSEQEARLVLRLTDEQGHLYETETPVVLYDSQTQVARYSTIYAVGAQSSPDTLTVDPLVAYDVEVLSKPAKVLKNQRFVPGQTTTLSIPMEQGSLRLSYPSKRTTVAIPSYPILVREQGRREVLNMQQMNEMQTYRSGLYDVEVLSVPPLRLEGIALQSNTTTELTIPLPGIVNVQKPKQICTGSVFQMVEGRLQWVLDLNPSKALERLMLMPGEYEVVLKPQSSIKYKDVIVKRFKVGSGETTNIQM